MVLVCKRADNITIKEQSICTVIAYQTAIKQEINFSIYKDLQCLALRRTGISVSNQVTP